MNIITAIEYSSAADCIASARAIRARLFNPPKQVREIAARPPKVEPFYASQIPLWERRPTHFDAHVAAWRNMRAMQFIRAVHPVRTYIEERSADFAFTYDELTGDRRFSRLCAVRHLITFEIKTIVNPSISLPELGKALGGRDHTTVLNSMVKMKAFGHEGRASLELRLRGSQKIPRNATGPNRGEHRRRLSA